MSTRVLMNTAKVLVADDGDMLAMAEHTSTDCPLALRARQGELHCGLGAKRTHGVAEPEYNSPTRAGAV